MAFWIMLIWVVAIYLLFRNSMTETVLCDDGGYEYRAKTSYAILLFAVPLLIVATRTEFGDTGTYIRIFENYSTDLSRLDYFANNEKAPLYSGLQLLFKAFISEKSTVWIAFVACLQGFLVMKTLKKHSVDLGFSVFVFIATALIGNWMCNGIRQFVAVAILFACTDWILKRKWYYYIPVAVLLMGLGPVADFLYFDSIPWYLGGVHQAVLIFLLSVPFINGKAFNKRLWILAAALAVLVFTGQLDDILSSSVETTTYVNDMDYVNADTGTSIFRVLVEAAPLALAAFVSKELKKPETPKIIQLSVNCSFVSTVLYVASAFTSGIYVGRLPIFFEMYNLILLPWLLSHPYKANRKMFTAFIMIAYTAYFFYQVNITWGMSSLVSYLPGLGG